MTPALLASFLFGLYLSELSPGISRTSVSIKMAAAHDSRNNDANNDVDIVNAFNSVPSAKWDGVANSLRTNSGVATIDFLPPDICSMHAACFETARRGLDVAKRNRGDDTTSAVIRKIGPNDDSAHATGYHCAGSDGSSMSRYNSYREGFVFSDGNIFDVDLGENDNERRQGQIIFQSDMETFFASMHDAIAVNVLRAIARNLGCQDENWFQTKLGPTDESSQWHVKRYVCPTATDGENECSECNDNRDIEEEIEWLPVHTDPSLISIVLHDVPGKREGAMGLQYQVPDPSSSSENDSNPKSKKKIWVDVPWHGHAVATVFVGSVLSYITGNLYPGAKHRVVYRPSKSIEESERVAATLFVRPRGDCKLLVPPSPLFLTAEGDSSVRIRNTTFDAWLARVSRNYMKGRNKNGESK